MSLSDGPAPAQVAEFIAKFDPSVAKLIRSCRAAVRKRMPAVNELVYDNNNFFVIGYCSTECASDCIISLAANAHAVTLFFYYGARLPDPAGILQGGGNQVRSIRMESAATLAVTRWKRCCARPSHMGRTLCGRLVEGALS